MASLEYFIITCKISKPQKEHERHGAHLRNEEIHDAAGQGEWEGSGEQRQEPG